MRRTEAVNPTATSLEAHVNGFGETFRSAWRMAEGTIVGVPGGRVVVVGLGGSAIAGDIAAALACHAGGDAMAIVRGHQLPAWVTRSDLVVVCSYSGSTKESLHALREAIRRHIPTIVVTANNQLAQHVRDAGAGAFVVEYEAPPRHSLACLLAPLVTLLVARDVLDAAEVEEAAGNVRALAEPGGHADERALELVGCLLGHPTLVTGAELMAPVARRWKTQLNENAKHLAFAEELPEAAHNTVEAVSFPGNQRPLVHVVLASPLYSSYALAASRSYVRVLEQNDAHVHEVAFEAQSAIGQVFEAVVLGDLVSLRLAAAKGVDPEPIPRIDALKRLATAALQGAPRD